MGQTCIKLICAHRLRCLPKDALISLQFSEEKQSLSFHHSRLERRSAVGFLSSVADGLHPSLARNCISTKSATPRGLRYYRRGFPRRPVIETRTTSRSRTLEPRLNQGNPRKKAGRVESTRAKHPLRRDISP